MRVNDCPAGVRKRRKATVKIRRNTLLRFLHMIRINFLKAYLLKADMRPDGRYIVTTPSTYLSGASYAIYNLVPDDIR